MFVNFYDLLLFLGIFLVIRVNEVKNMQINLTMQEEGVCADADIG